MTLEEEIRKAGKTKDFLDNPLFKEAVSEVQQALIEGIKRAAFKDKELIVCLSQELRALDAVVAKLQSVVETGHLAATELQQKSIAERAKDAWNSFAT